MIFAFAFVVIPWELGAAFELPIVVVALFAITAVLALGATRVPVLATPFWVKRS